jgi:hypothetical protein
MFCHVGTFTRVPSFPPMAAVSSAAPLQISRTVPLAVLHLMRKIYTTINQGPMSESTNETGQPNNGPAQEGPSAHQARNRPLDSLLDSLRRGAQEARRAADRALPRVKTAAAEADYWGGLAFAASFAAALVAEVTPEAAKRGCREGSQAGKQAARNWTREAKDATSTDTAVPPLLAQGAEGPQPGTA